MKILFFMRVSQNIEMRKTRVAIPASFDRQGFVDRYVVRYIEALCSVAEKVWGICDYDQPRGIGLQTGDEPFDEARLAVLFPKVA